MWPLPCDSSCHVPCEGYCEGYRDSHQLVPFICVQHDESEYGADMSTDGRHTGGPFTIRVSPKMRIEELRNVIRDVGGVLPALQVGARVNNVCFKSVATGQGAYFQFRSHHLDSRTECIIQRATWCAEFSNKRQCWVCRDRMHGVAPPASYLAEVVICWQAPR